MAKTEPKSHPKWAPEASKKELKKFEAQGSVCWCSDPVCRRIRKETRGKA